MPEGIGGHVCPGIPGQRCGNLEAHLAGRQTPNQLAIRQDQWSRLALRVFR